MCLGVIFQVSILVYATYWRHNTRGAIEAYESLLMEETKPLGVVDSSEPTPLPVSVLAPLISWSPRSRWHREEEDLSKLMCELLLWRALKAIIKESNIRLSSVELEVRHIIVIIGKKEEECKSLKYSKHQGLASSFHKRKRNRPRHLNSLNSTKAAQLNSTKVRDLVRALNKA